MKKAIEYLRNQNIKVSDAGFILSALPDGVKGLKLIDGLQDHTMGELFCYTIIGDQIKRQYV